VLAGVLIEGGEEMTVSIAKSPPSLGSYLTDGTRLFRRVPAPTDLEQRVALEDCASLAIEYYSPAQFRKLDLRTVSRASSSGR
jgi:hypothetical protein